MKVAVIGAGFVGLTTAIVLAEEGNQVSVIENDHQRLSKLTQGEIPFYEPDLLEAFRKAIDDNLLSVVDWEKAPNSNPEVVVVCGGTPSRDDGSIDLSQIYEIIETCLIKLRGISDIVIKSTVLPGTTRDVQDKFQNITENLKIAMVPEFLREGSALEDARKPDRIVIGSNDSEQVLKLKKLFATKNSNVIVTNTFNAEIIKYASNTFLANCISFSNEFFGLFNNDKDFNLDDVLDGWQSDKRFQVNGIKASITNYLRPGFGFGGSCFPKDVRAVTYLAEQVNPSSSLLPAIMKVNYETINSTCNWLSSIINPAEEVLILGVAFKENSDDLRESPALKLIESLTKNGYKVSWYDKWVNQNVSLPNCNRVNAREISQYKNLVWTNNDTEIRKTLMSLIFQNTKLYLLRYQEAVDGFMNVYQRTWGINE